jgi:hypothetical protein
MIARTIKIDYKRRILNWKIAPLTFTKYPLDEQTCDFEIIDSDTSLDDISVNILLYRSVPIAYFPVHTNKALQLSSTYTLPKAKKNIHFMWEIVKGKEYNTSISTGFSIRFSRRFTQVNIQSMISLHVPTSPLLSLSSKS